MASSEDDKVPPTPSTLEAVKEKMEVEPAEDQTSDKLSDEGLGTSEVDKTEEEKLNEVSDASNEDLASGLVEPSKDVISHDSTEPKPEEGQGEETSAEQVVSQPEEPVNTTDNQELVTETEEEQKETEERIMGDETTQVMEQEKEPEQGKQEEEKEAGKEESRESQAEPEDAEKPESVPRDEPEVEEESKESEEETTESKVTQDTMEDMANGTDENVNIENIESDGRHAFINEDTKLGVDESSPEPVETKPEEKPMDEAHEESQQPEQESQITEEAELKEQVPTDSTNGICDEVKDTPEDSVVPPKDSSVKEEEEKATHADESTSQDAVSVQESETDSEAKMEQGSPAVIRPDVEKDSDSGSSSAADSNSLDLNLSISSFLSKSKEGGSVSLQVIQSVPQLHHQLLNYQHYPDYSIL